MQGGNGWESGSRCPWLCSLGSLGLLGLPFPLLQVRVIPFILKSLESVPTGSVDGAMSNPGWLQNPSLFPLGWLKLELGGAFILLAMLFPSCHLS